MPCADLVDGDCLLGAVDFLDFCELAAYLASSKRLSLHACAAWDARSWRMQSLEARIPNHVKWRPANCPPDPQLKGSLLACATWRLARGVQLYEQKRFKNAEDELRALLTILPGRPFAMCRLADTLYGRAVSLHSASQPSSRSSTPASAGEAWVEPTTHRDEIDGDQGDPDRDEAEEELPMMPYSHSPLSPAPVGQDQADQATEMDPVQSAPSVMSEPSDPIVVPEPLISRAAVVRWQQTAEDLPGAVATTERDLTSSTASASTPRTPQGQQPQTPPPWTTSWTPPLEVDEGLEAEAEMQERDMVGILMTPSWIELDQQLKPTIIPIVLMSFQFWSSLYRLLKPWP